MLSSRFQSLRNAVWTTSSRTAFWLHFLLSLICW
nr:MAG TPA: hypothetical protein [Caudoviricetes sp.]